MDRKKLGRALSNLTLLSMLVTITFSYFTARPAMAASNYLHTSGNKIYDASNQIVGLSGLNWFGFETANNAPHGLWTRNWESIR